MAIQLSICIPTYNREKYLKQLLDCIEKQLQYTDKNIVEICVSDNSSTDNTQQMIQQYQQKYNNITYFRWDKNMGADMNYLKVVEIAHGKYCWLFGSDDLMIDGAIKKMLEEIKEDCDIYLCNRVECDINMKQLKKSYIINSSSQIFFLDDKKDLINYFKHLQSLNGLFTYLSSIVVKKNQWDLIDFDKSFIGTAYVHSYILLSLLNNNKIKLKYINDHLVLNRGNNDTFLCMGIVNRIKLDFEGFKMLFCKIFRDKSLDIYYEKLLKLAYPYYRILYILSKLNKGDRKKLLDIIKPARHNLIILNYGHILYRIFPYYLCKLIYRKINELIGFIK